MSAAEQEIAQLKEHIAEGAEQTKSYLATLQSKLHEYDEHYKVTDTASGYLQAGLDTAHASVDELKNLGSKIQTGTMDASHAAVESAKGALAKVQASLEDLKARAIDYDQRAKTTLTTTVSSTRNSVAGSIEYLVTSTRSGATGGIERIAATIASVQSAIGERATAAGESAFALTGSIVKKAEAVDEKLGLSGTVVGAAVAVTERVVSLDKKFGVSETAMKVDEKVSGGIGVSLLEKGANLVHQGVDYVTSTLQSAKLAADKAEQPAVTNGEAPAEAVKAVEGKKPAEAEKSAEAEKPAEAAKPAETEKPAEAEKPAAAEPVKAAEPAAVEAEKAASS